MRCYVFDNYVWANWLINLGYPVRKIRPNFNKSGMVYEFDIDAEEELKKIIEERREINRAYGECDEV